MKHFKGTIWTGAWKI